jgi:hypothetical protein
MALKRRTWASARLVAAEECHAGMAQVGIAMVPELTRVAGKGRVLRSAAYPVESAAQFAGDAGKVIRREASAFGQALAASYRSPETTVGEAIVGFGAVEMMSQLILGDVTDEADMSSRGLQGTVAVAGAQVVAVPGTAEERDDLSRARGCEARRRIPRKARGGRRSVGCS